MKREDLERLAHSEKWEERRKAASDPECPSEILSKLTGDNDLEVRKAVAANPNTLSEALVTLAEDRVWWIREAVVRNSNTPPETLRYLAHDGSKSVRDAACTQLEQRGLDWHLEGEARQDILRWLAAHRHAVNRYEAARASDCPPELLSRLLVMDEDWHVRKAAVVNPNVPVDALEQLSDDEHESVRAAACEQLEQRKREAACADYEAELNKGGMGYGDGL